MTAPGVRTGALLAGAAVILGAFGAHALKDRLSPEELAVWETAVQYQAWHALGLVLHGLSLSRTTPGAHRPGEAWPAWAFLFGIVLFSGSLYGLALGGPRWLGPITPLGGLAFIAGWGLFAWTTGTGRAGSRAGIR